MVRALRATVLGGLEMRRILALNTARGTLTNIGTFFLLKIAGQEHPDRRVHTKYKKWVALAANTQLSQLFHNLSREADGFRRLRLAGLTTKKVNTSP
jgi:hypothetical protein